MTTLSACDWIECRDALSSQLILIVNIGRQC